MENSNIDLIELIKRLMSDGKIIILQGQLLGASIEYVSTVTGNKSCSDARLELRSLVRKVPYLSNVDIDKFAIDLYMYWYDHRFMIDESQRDFCKKIANSIKLDYYKKL